jgi:hypothetical protein
MLPRRDPSNPALPTQTIVQPKTLGIVALDVDKSPTGASYMVSSTLDSVISRWSIDGEQQGRKELGPGAFHSLFCFSSFT